MDKEQMLEVLKCASKFMAKQDVRHYLNGVSLEFSHEQVIVTATDGHRLFNVTMTGSHGVTVYGQHIIGGEDIAKILKLYDYKKDKNLDLKWSDCADGPELTISDGTISFTMEPVDGKFPNWELVIPTFGGKGAKSSTHCTFGMNMDYLASACNALKPLGNKAYKGAKITIADEYSSALIEVSGPDYHALENIRAVVMPMRL